MFETLTKGFRSAKQRFQGVAELDEATVDEALKDVRTALLEADVGFDVVQDFCQRVQGEGGRRDRQGEGVDARRRSAASAPRITSSSSATTSWSS